MQGVELHIGGQTRVLKFTTSSVLLFKSWMPGNIGLREALVLHKDPSSVGLALAAALRHADAKVTPSRVMTWLDQEPARYLDAEAAVVRAAEGYFYERGIIEEPPGEAPAASVGVPTPSSTSGTTSSALLGGGALTPSASGS